MGGSRGGVSATIEGEEDKDEEDEAPAAEEATAPIPARPAPTGNDDLVSCGCR